MARKKKPSGRKKHQHRVWIPNDGYGGLRMTGGHGMMRIDQWPDGTYEYRYVFCLCERLFGDGNADETWEQYVEWLKHGHFNPYERLDGGDLRESFGLAKMDADARIQEWIEVEPHHWWAVPTDIS